MDYWRGGGGGGQRVCWPPFQIIVVGPAPLPLLTPMITASVVNDTQGHQSRGRKIDPTHLRSFEWDFNPSPYDLVVGGMLNPEVTHSLTSHSSNISLAIITMIFIIHYFMTLFQHSYLLSIPNTSSNIAINFFQHCNYSSPKHPPTNIPMGLYNITVIFLQHCHQTSHSFTTTVFLHLFSRFSHHITVKHLISAVTNFRGLMKRTCWRIRISTFIINHGFR